MGNLLTIASFVVNFVGIMLMVMYGLPKFGRLRPIEDAAEPDHLLGIVGLTLFALGTAVRITTLLIVPG